MQYALHAATKYQVQWGPEVERLSVDPTETNWLLDSLFPDSYFNYDSVGDSDVVEIDKETFKQGLEDLKELEEPALEGLSNEELYKELKSLLDNSDPELDYVRLEWF